MTELLELSTYRPAQSTSGRETAIHLHGSSGALNAPMLTADLIQTADMVVFQTTGSPGYIIYFDRGATEEGLAVGITLADRPAEPTPAQRLEALRVAARARAASLPATATLDAEELLEREGISAGMQLLQDETLDR